MSEITEVKTPNAPAPLPVFSQAIKANGMVYDPYVILSRLKFHTA